MYSNLELYIDGKWHGADGRKGEDVINPATEKPLAHLPHASKADLDQALAAATKGFAVWRATSAYDRYAKRYEHWDMPGWGWKYNLDNIRASLLLPQIHRLDERWRRRVAIAERYEAAFRQLSGVEFPQVPMAQERCAIGNPRRAKTSPPRSSS